MSKIIIQLKKSENFMASVFGLSVGLYITAMFIYLCSF